MSTASDRRSHEARRLHRMRAEVALLLLNAVMWASLGVVFLASR
jgi:hypothetical protein